MEPKKSTKTAKMDFTFFGTRREHEKIAKMQRYSPRKLSKIIIIKICLVKTIMLNYRLDLTFLWKTIIFNNSFEKKKVISQSKMYPNMILDLPYYISKNVKKKTELWLWNWIPPVMEAIFQWFLMQRNQLSHKISIVG